MKRIFAVSSLVVALAAPSLASGAGFNLEPKRKQAPEPAVSFVVKVKNGKPKRVTRTVFRDVPVNCTEGTYVVSNVGSPLGKMKVTQKTKKFRGDFRANGGAQRVGISGKVIKKGKRVVGKIRVRGAFTDPTTGGPVTNCDSGVLPYRSVRARSTGL